VSDADAGSVSDADAGSVRDADAGSVSDADAGSVRDADAGSVRDSDAGSVSDADAGSVSDADADLGPAEPAPQSAAPSELDRRAAVQALQSVVLARINSLGVRGWLELCDKTSERMQWGICKKSNRRPLRVLMRTCDALAFLQRLSNSTYHDDFKNAGKSAAPFVPLADFLWKEAWHIKLDRHRPDELIFRRYTHKPDQVFFCGVEINSDYADHAQVLSLHNPPGPDRGEAWRGCLSWVMNTISAAKQASLVSDATVRVPADYGEVDCTEFTALPCILWLGGRSIGEMKKTAKAQAPSAPSAPSLSASAPAWVPAPGQWSTWVPYPAYGWGYGYAVPGHAPGTAWQ